VFHPTDLGWKSIPATKHEGDIQTTSGEINVKLGIAIICRRNIPADILFTSRYEGTFQGGNLNLIFYTICLDPMDFAFESVDFWRV
jgi:hypothetical protein